jgi:phospholipid N-methyltransferase
MALPSARRFRRKLRDYFNEVRIDRTVWVNVPPAFVYQCRL